MSVNARYTISDLSYYTGIKPHTIRAWEKRYNLLAPSRSCTNIRGYDSCQLRKLLNINSLINAGWKISRISQLKPDEMDSELRMIMEQGTGGQKVDFLINGLMVHMLNFDERRFSEVFNQAVENYGVKNAILQIVYPFLKRIGVLWQIEDISPSQEHFASAIIRRKVLAEIEKMQVNTPCNQTMVLCLPPDEFHELPLLLAHYILLENQINTIYLGSSVPPEVAAAAAQQTHASHLFTLFMSSAPMENLKGYLHTIHELVPDLKIYFSGCPQMCKKPITNSKIVYINGIEEFETMVKAIRMPLVTSV